MESACTGIAAGSSSTSRVLVCFLFCLVVQKEKFGDFLGKILSLLLIMNRFLMFALNDSMTQCPRAYI